MWAGLRVFTASIFVFFRLQRAPVGVGASANADEAGHEDGRSEDGSDHCEVHGISPVARAAGHSRDCGALLLHLLQLS
jgi:hypothetical protein